MNSTEQPAVEGPVEPTVMQHTDEPWEWGGDIGDDEYVVKVGRLRMVEFRYSGTTTVEAVANERIAAAAPALLAELMRMYEAFKWTDESDGQRDSALSAGALLRRLGAA